MSKSKKAAPKKKNAAPKKDTIRKPVPPKKPTTPKSSTVSLKVEWIKPELGDANPKDRLAVHMEYPAAGGKRRKTVLGAIQKDDSTSWAADLPERVTRHASPQEAAMELVCAKSGKIAAALVGAMAKLELEVLP